MSIQWGDLDIATGKLYIDKQVYPVNGKLILNVPKTRAAIRTIILPQAIVELLAEYKKAALDIDKGIVKVDFTPVPLSRHRQGTGCISQINETLWEGRCSPKWPDGVKRPRNVYANSREECEEKLKELILEIKGEMAARRSGANTEYPENGNSKKKAIATYLREHPGVTNKSRITRDLQIDRSTVRRYYDEIRAEFPKKVVVECSRVVEEVKHKKL